MLTNFGKTLRKIRIDHNELLKDMAARLNVTVAYLSAVENGKREVPDSWVNMVAVLYDLSSEEAKQLQTYAYEKKDSIKISFEGVDEQDKEMALAFARSFKTLTDEERMTLARILGS